MYPERIGDMLVTGDIDTVFGPMDTESGVEELPESFRTHGGSDEANVPLIVYNREVEPRDWHGYRCNYDLIKSIGF